MLEKFKSLSMKDKTEIINSYFLEDKKWTESTMLQYLFYLCVEICDERNANNIKMSADIGKLNKKATFKFTLIDDK